MKEALFAICFLGLVVACAAEYFYQGKPFDRPAGRDRVVLIGIRVLIAAFATVLLLMLPSCSRQTNCSAMSEEPVAHGDCT